MKEAKIRVFQKINKKYRILILGLIVFIFLISTFFALKAIGQPLNIEEKATENKIEERTSFDYAASVHPSTLYPQGGKIAPDGVIFTNLTDKLIVQIDSSISAEKPVRVEGKVEVIYTLTAKDMWEREFNLVSTQGVNLQGTTNSLLKKEIQIDLEKISSYIKRVEEETLVRPSNYMLTIKPKIKGTVYGENDNVIYEIDNGIDIPFELSGQYVKYAAESPEKEFIKTKILESTKQVPQSFDFFGMKMPIVSARYIFGIISIISLAFILIALIEKSMTNKKIITEVSLIDKKNKNKIIEVSDDVNFGELPQLSLKSFKALLQIAEEKEEPILRYSNHIEGTVYYYVLGTTITYYYRSSENIVAKGSELSHVS